MIFRPGDRVAVRAAVNGNDGWRGLTAAVIGDSDTWLPGLVQVQLDEGQERPDGFQGDKFYLGPEHLTLVDGFSFERALAVLAEES